MLQPGQVAQTGGLIHSLGTAGIPVDLLEGDDVGTSGSDYGGRSLQVHPLVHAFTCLML